MTPKLDVRVKLTGVDGNVFNLIGACTAAMKRAGIDKATIKRFVDEVTRAGSYHSSLAVMAQWLEVE